ncbi:hypothetical protein N1851_012485 [Merluccius polli]|uniref:Uncharacterized protein n=1 Tax=Merluccius polli TaxID=89951 RepID=A0AA47MWF6_MERPO|nr:hypothetical protein N1851_012485 [Merluccius polli]
MEQACDHIEAASVQGWIRHTRRFFQRCLANEDIACDRTDSLWGQDLGEASREGDEHYRMAMQKSTAQLTSAISSPRRMRNIQSSPTRDIRNFWQRTVQTGGRDGASLSISTLCALLPRLFSFCPHRCQMALEA